MSAATQDFMIETLVWTGVLLALVLIVRRPVARYFGSQAAYALWALPIARLLLPPVVLPAWLAPVEETAVPIIEPGSMIAGANSVSAFAAPDAASMQAATQSPALPSVDWLALVLAVWLLGAAIFLAVRFGYYFRMRRELLENAKPVGESGKIRLVETPATSSPIAFGVIDKVIALPVGFMALGNKAQRNLALEHEFAHHRAHDLLANVLVQPLFALHWFNPLGRLGWRAMRRDQEAACDARVIAARGNDDRAEYASVIAHFAAGPDAAPRFSLAAPMACPVIGEKSIIHRLRSLTMSDISPRRRFAGKALLGAVLVALPLTASISYAAADIPAPPAAPTAPAALTAVPLPPAPPAPPSPPPALSLQAAPEAVVDEWTDESADKDERMVREVHVIREVEVDEDGQKRKVEKQRRIVLHGMDHKLSKAEREKIMRELREGLAEAEAERREAFAEHRRAILEARAEADGVTRISLECDKNGKAGETKTKDGRTIVKLCTSRIMANALTGLKAAREAIASNPEMPDDIRAEVLQSLDEQIRGWRTDG